MTALSWHDYLLITSCLTSAVGLTVFCHCPIPEPNAAEATQETLVRMTFIYWMLYCLSRLGQLWCDSTAQDFVCSLRVLALLSYVLTFCCVVSLPLHTIEQRR
ncbi:MAG: hypothetical protein WCD18_11495 [Thermosynechococcaceae cyanobacterium]